MCSCRCMFVAVSTLQSPECQRQRRARTLSPPPPRTVEQPQACLICRSFIMAISVAKANQPAGAGKGAWSRRQALSTLRRASGRDEPAHIESASTSHWQRHTTCTTWCVAASTLRPLECQRQRRASTLSRPPPRTVEQPQAHSICRSSLAKANHLQVQLQEPGRGGKHSPPTGHGGFRRKGTRAPAGAWS